MINHELDENSQNSTISDVKLHETNDYEEDLQDFMYSRKKKLKYLIDNQSNDEYTPIKDRLTSNMKSDEKSKLLKEVARDRGVRLQYIRINLLEMSIKRLAQSMGIHEVTLRRLEAGYTRIRQPIAELICIKCLENGIMVNLDWLMWNDGIEPKRFKVPGLLASNNSEAEMTKLVSILVEARDVKGTSSSYAQNRNMAQNMVSKILSILYGNIYVTCVVNDKRMEPRFLKGAQVFGHWISNNVSYLSRTNGVECIVKRDNNILMIRKVFINDTGNYIILSSYNTEYKPEIVSVNTPLGVIIGVMDNPSTLYYSDLQQI